MVQQGKILGHIVSKNGISIDLDKIKTTWDLARVVNPQCFMCHCGYYRCFVFMYIVIAKPIYALLVEYVWTKEWKKAFVQCFEKGTSFGTHFASFWLE